MKNDSRSNREITLLERIPVSEMEEVVVTILPETTSDYKETRKGSGLLQWKFSLAPGAKRTFVVSYRVEVPDSMSGNFFGK